MSDKQYGIRFYDGQGCIGPLSRDEVITRMNEDHSVIPVERRKAHDGIWTPWVDSSDFKESDA